MITSYPILYSFRRCPYAIRARLALAYANQQVEIREVVLKNKPQGLLNISLKATVPVLQLKDGRVLDESLDIMLWALGKSDPECWLPNDVELVEKTQALIHWNDNEFKPWLDKYKYHDRHPRDTKENYRKQAEIFLQHLGDILDSQAYLIGDKPGLADMAIFPFIRQFAYVDYVWFASNSRRGLINWLENLLKSPLFNSVMQKLPTWKEGDAVTLFPR